MKIDINNHRKIFATQEEFSAMFPGLKIGFNANPNKQGGAPIESSLKRLKADHKK